MNECNDQTHRAGLHRHGSARFFRAAEAQLPDLPVRYMPDGSPCWCQSHDEPHEGWVHGSACYSKRVRYVEVLRMATAELVATLDLLAEYRDDDSPALNERFTKALEAA